MAEDISLKRAIIINFASKYADLFVQILYIAILSRILRPNDFGIVAIISVFTIFFSIFADMGLGSAVIQNKSLSCDDVKNIFSFSIYLAIGVALVFTFFSIPLALIYDNNIYMPLGLILSVSLFFNTLNTVPNALLLKDKKFVLLGLRRIIVVVASSILTIFMAIAGFKYYALVINSVIIAFFTFILNYKGQNLMLRLKLDKRSLVKIRNYSVFLFGFNFMTYFTRNLDKLIIGKLWGDGALAYYNMAYNLMLYPVSNLTSVITPVIHPILSEHQNDKNYIYDHFLQMIRLLSVIAIFISTYCFFAAKEIVLITLGSQWEASVPCFKWLSISIWSQMIVSTSGSIFQTLGKTNLQFFRGLVTTLITIIAILTGIFIGKLEAVAIGVAIAYNMHFLSMLYFLVHRGFRQSSLKFFNNLLPDIYILVMIIVVMNIANFTIIDCLVLSGLYKGVVCGLTYVFGLILTKQHKLLLTSFLVPIKNAIGRVKM